MIHPINSDFQRSLQRAIDHAGSVTALADAVGVGVSAVYNWRTRGRVSLTAALRIEELTEHALTVYDLCPQLREQQEAQPCRTI